MQTSSPADQTTSDAALGFSACNRSSPSLTRGSRSERVGVGVPQVPPGEDRASGLEALRERPPKSGPVLMGVDNWQTARERPIENDQAPTRSCHPPQVQADLDAGLNVSQACAKPASPSTYYRWKSTQENPKSNEQLRGLNSKPRRSAQAPDRRAGPRPTHAPGGLEKKAMTAARRRIIAGDMRRFRRLAAARAGRWSWPVGHRWSRTSVTSGPRWPGGSRPSGRIHDMVTGGSGSCSAARAGRSTRRRCVATGDRRG